MEKLENKLIDMREIYQEYKEKSIHDLVSQQTTVSFPDIVHHTFSSHMVTSAFVSDPPQEIRN